MPGTPGLVDGVTTAPDTYGIIQGDGGSVDKIAGSSGNDKLEGHAAFNQYYGGAGNDTFLLNSKFAVAAGAHDGASTAFGDQFAYITDFQGAAGSGNANGGDFINFMGGQWDASSLTLTHTGATSASGATMYYYAVSDIYGHTFNIQVNSLNGQKLGAGDFMFS